MRSKLKLKEGDDFEIKVNVLNSPEYDETSVLPQVGEALLGSNVEDHEPI